MLFQTDSHEFTVGIRITAQVIMSSIFNGQSIDFLVLKTALLSVEQIRLKAQIQTI